MGIHPLPVALVILDGWGYREEADANAIAHADTPVWDRLWRTRPHTLIKASGSAVGLPSGQMGNSEVGHLNLGAGRVVYQEFTRVSRAIRTGSFFRNQTLTGAVELARTRGARLHIMGLLSPGGVHSHEEHIQAMVRLAVEGGVGDVCVHAFLDGRDTPPKSAEASLRRIQGLFGELGAGRIATLIGRFYAMDRDNRWPRIRRAYDLMTLGEAAYHAPNPLQALAMAYARDESDEFVQPTVIDAPGGDSGRIRDGDVLVFMNYRSDRARQLTRAFIEPGFDGFERRHWPRLARFISLTEYNAEFRVPVAFPPERLKNTFGEFLARRGLTQLRLAETEKYAHVTFFFNGGREAPFEAEERILVPSPQVATYDQKPEMSADQVAHRLIEGIRSGRFDAIVCNFANPDMVGHTGDFAAAVKAIEAVDRCLGRVLHALIGMGGAMLVTADHGNADLMRDPGTGQPHTAHTANPVPLIYVGERPARFLPGGGALCDVAPTLLSILGLEPPGEMTGQSLLRFDGSGEADPGR